MNQHHRYQGPELSALLEQVRRELGEEATIHEANKIRTGGLAGFFASESFEVIASRAPERYDFDDLPDLIDFDGPDPDGRVDLAPIRRERPGRSPGGGGVGAALLERAEAISIQERIQLSRPREGFAVDLRQGAEPFGSHLQRELDDSRRRTRAVRPGFWDLLRDYEKSTMARDVDSPLVAVVGNLESAVGLAQRLVRQPSEADRELVVLTPTKDALGLPPWQVATRSKDLAERLHHWSSFDRRAIVVFDVAFGETIMSELERVRRSGCGLVHLALDQSLSARKVFGMLQEIGGNAVLDIMHEADPSYLLGLVARGVPLVSVAGRRVDPAFLLALSAHVTNG